MVGTVISARRHTGLLRAAVVASAVIVLAVALVLAVLALALARARDSNERVRRTELVLRTAADAEKSLIDIETALRGYVITRESDYLAPYRSGIPGARANADRLVALTAGDRRLAGTARSIRSGIRSYISGYARPLVLLAQRAPNAAQSTVATAEGRRRIDALRSAFAVVSAVERDRLTARTRSADRSATRAIVVGIGGLLALLAMVIVFGAYVARRIAAPVRRIADASTRVAEGDLSVRVPQGGAGELDQLSRAFNEMAGSLAAAQGQLRRRAVELEATGARTLALLDTVYDRAPVGLAVFDEHLRFVRVNAALAAMDGVPEEQHLGRSIGEVLPGMAGELGARLRDVLTERRTIADAELHGTTRGSPDAELVWRASYFPVVLESGELIGSGAIVADITEHRRAARERRRLLATERLAAQQTARLQEMTGALSRAVGAHDVAQVVVDQGMAALEARAGVVVLTFPGAAELELAALSGYDEHDALDWRDLSVATAAPLAEAVRSVRTVIVPDRRTLRERYPERRDVLEHAGHGAWVAAPIAGGGVVRGAALFAFAGSRVPGDADVRLLELLLAQAGQALDRAALYERQRHIASTLQRSLLPARMPQIPGVEIAAIYRPAGDGNEVGGDFYDVVPMRDGRWLVAIGDVEGKGPEAAALTGLVRHTLRAETMHENDPAELVRRLNRVVYLDETDRFCTVALAAIAPPRGGAQVRIACGGHLPPIVTRRADAPAEIRCRGTLLGVQEDIRVATVDLELGAGDGLVLYTDGVLDAGAPATTLTAGHLVELLAGAGAGPPHELARLLHDAAISGADAPRDDIAIIALRVDGGPPASGGAPGAPSIIGSALSG